MGAERSEVRTEWNYYCSIEDIVKWIYSNVTGIKKPNQQLAENET